ncbi:hypothetical protein VNO77_07674 [Canavalia gladiata]|uniref:Uncharacterized protein n=1 Tax=Canavalia gladiata TaxID=3824 RepID=A0AAN9MDH2_CANGL
MIAAAGWLVDVCHNMCNPFVYFKEEEANHSGKDNESNIACKGTISFTVSVQVLNTKRLRYIGFAFREIKHEFAKEKGPTKMQFHANNFSKSENKVMWECEALQDMAPKGGIKRGVGVKKRVVCWAAVFCLTNGGT